MSLILLTLHNYYFYQLSYNGDKLIKLFIIFIFIDQDKIELSDDHDEQEHDHLPEETRSVIQAIKENNEANLTKITEEMAENAQHFLIIQSELEEERNSLLSTINTQYIEMKTECENQRKLNEEYMLEVKKEFEQKINNQNKDIERAVDIIKKSQSNYLLKGKAEIFKHQLSDMSESRVDDLLLKPPVFRRNETLQTNMQFLGSVTYVKPSALPAKVIRKRKFSNITIDFRKALSIFIKFRM